MAKKYVIRFEVDGLGDLQPQEVIEGQQAAQPQQTQIRETTQRKQRSELGSIGSAGAGLVAAGAFNYALQQPSRSGNTQQQQTVNNLVGLGTKLAIAATSTKAAVVVGVSMAVEIGTYLLNENRRLQQETRQQNNAILRAGRNRNGRSR